MPPPVSPLRILFLCTGNSCRSQMAEGFARALHPGLLEAHSAGIVAKGLNPLAVRAMAERGIDISRQHSKTILDLANQRFDVVVTVCGHAHETCPVFPGRARIIHQGFDDPPELAKSAPTDDEAMTHYRRVRDEIGRYVQNLPATLAALPGYVPAG